MHYHDDGVVLLGNGDGTFRNAIPLSPEIAIAHPIAADFDGDGRVDLAGSSSRFTVGVFPGNGDGTFNGPRESPIWEWPSNLVAADFDQDARLDLGAALREDAQVSVLLGQGDGTFTERRLATDWYPAGIVAADFDGNGRADVAIFHGVPSGFVSVLLGSGDGNFTVEGRLATGSNPWDLVAAELDGDGRMDLATVNQASSDLSLLLGNGDGTFRIEERYDIGGGFVDLIAADLDADGRLDLALASGYELSFLRNGRVDRTSPGLSCPGSLSVVCSVPAGALVDFTVAAEDDCDPQPLVACDFPPGTLSLPGPRSSLARPATRRGTGAGAPSRSRSPARGELPGDCDLSGDRNISDPVCLLRHLFSGESLLPCGDRTSAECREHRAPRLERRRAPRHLGRRRRPPLALPGRAAARPRPRVPSRSRAAPRAAGKAAGKEPACQAV